MNWQNYIASDSTILKGKPAIKGTRISVELVLELLASGWSEQDLFDAYPVLNKAVLMAVYAYLQDCVKQETYFSITA